MRFSRSKPVLSWTILLASCFLTASLFVACGTEDQAQEREEETSELTIDEQIAEATGAINRNRFDATAFHRRADLHLMNRNLAAAEDDIKVAMKIDNAVGAFHFTLADIHLAKGDVVIATEALSDGLELDRENVPALLALSELYYAMRDMKQSVILIKRVLEIEKYNAQAYLIHGLIFIELGDTAKALASFQRATENDPSMEEPYLELGMIHYARLNPLAVDYLNNVIRLNPQNMLAIYTKAMFYQKTGEVDLAIDTYNEMLELNPSHPEANYNLGHINIQFKEDFETAILFFDKALNIDSSHHKAMYMRGLCMENLGKYPEARDDYQKALGILTNYDLAIEGLNRLDRGGH